jgi:hypothetical protein
VSLPPQLVFPGCGFTNLIGEMAKNILTIFLNYYRVTTIGATTFKITTLSTMPFRITAFGIMSFSYTSIGIWHYFIHYKGTTLNTFTINCDIVTLLVPRHSR